MRLVLLWLRSCNRLMARFMGTTRGVELKLGCRLVQACLCALHGREREAREALFPVSMRAVAPALAEATLEWAHHDWNLRGLAGTPFGQWALAWLSSDVGRHVAEERDKSPRGMRPCCVW